MADDINVRFGADTEDLDSGTERAKEDIASFESAIDELQNSLENLKNQISQGFDTNKINQVKDGLNETNAGARRASGGVDLLGGAVRGFIAGLSIQALKSFVVGLSDAAQETSNLSQELGLTIQQVQELSAIAAFSGTSTKALAQGQSQLAKNLVAAKGGAEEQLKVFKALDIDVNKVKNSQELLGLVADRFKTYADGPEKTALAMKLMGKAGVDMIPTLNEGSEGLKEMADRARELGVVNEEFIQRGLEMNDTIDETTLGLQGTGQVLFNVLEPAANSVVSVFNDMIKGFIESYQEGGTAKIVMDAVAVVLKALASVVIIVAGAFSGVFNVAVGATTVALAALAGSMEALQRVMQGDLQGAAQAFSRWMDAGAKGATSKFQQVVNDGKKMKSDLDKLWSGAPTGAAKGDKPAAPIVPGTGGEAAARAAAAAAKRRAQEQYRDKIAALNLEQEAVKDHFEQVMKLEEQKLQLTEQMYGKDSQQYQNMLREKLRLQDAYNQEMVRKEQDRISLAETVKQTELNADRQVAAIELQIEDEKIQAMRTRGQLSAQEEIQRKGQLAQQKVQLERQHEQQVYSIKLQAFRDQLALENLRPQERERILAQIEKLEADHAARIKVITAEAAAATKSTQIDAATAMQQKWQTILQPMQQGFSNLFQTMYNGTMNFKQAFLQMLDQMLFAFVDMAIKSAIQWVTNEAVKTSATTAGVAARTSAEAGGAAAGASVSGGSALMSIMNSAWQAAAGAYAAIAAIPYVGPFLAPVVAAGLLATVIGFAGNIVSSRGGLGRVTQDGQIAELHKDETVLPANLATPLRDMLENWGPRSHPLGAMQERAANASSAGNVFKAGDINMTYAPQNQVADGGLEAMLKRDSVGLKRWMKNEVRNRRLNLGTN